ncbi:MAG: TRAP transporter small permease [Synergistales bacterium]|nr:TRAP transporter small permease [Synergistales bacterium]
MEADTLVTFLERLSAWSAGALLVLNVGDILLGIFCRYVLKNSIIWTEEVARFSLVWLVLMAAAGAYYHGDHMVIDFVVHRFPKRIQTIVSWFRLSLTVFILSLMICLGFVNAVKIWHMRTMALGIPKTIPLLSVPVGLSVLLMIIILKSLNSQKQGGSSWE